MTFALPRIASFDAVMTAGFGCVLVATIVVLAIIDWNRMILPDRLNLLMAGVGLGQSVSLGLPDPIDAALGSVIGGAGLLLLARLFRRLRGADGLGRGDVKFVAAAGIWIGWQGVPMMLFIASTSALAFAAILAARDRRFDRSVALPFGPFLGAGTLVAWLAMVSS